MAYGFRIAALSGVRGFGRLTLLSRKFVHDNIIICKLSPLVTPSINTFCELRTYIRLTTGPFVEARALHQRLSATDVRLNISNLMSYTVL